LQQVVFKRDAETGNDRHTHRRMYS
jgi:hypothetical protein